MAYYDNDEGYLEEEIEEEGDELCALCGGDMEDGVCTACGNAASEEEELLEEETDGLDDGALE